MATEVMALVLRADLGDSPAKFVLIGLAEHAHPDGTRAYPSVRRLVAYTRLGESTVRRKLSYLRDQGIIYVVEENTGVGPIEYAIDLDRLRSLESEIIQELDGRKEKPANMGGEYDPSRSETPQTETPPAERGDPSRSERDPSRSGADPSRSGTRTVLNPIQPSIEPREEEVVASDSESRSGDDHHSSKARIIRCWEAACGPITPMIADSLIDLAQECSEHRMELPDGSAGAEASGDEWVVDAIEEASKSSTGPFNVRFLQSILDRWKVQGFKAPFRRSGSETDGLAEALGVTGDKHGQQ